MQTAYCIDRSDNVAVALAALVPGRVKLTGESDEAEVTLLEPVPEGHKAALRDLEEGSFIIKYGVDIGKATIAIKKGTWVHLHCMTSLYDERSGHLDVETGVPLDMPMNDWQTQRTLIPIPTKNADSKTQREIAGGLPGKD